MTRAALLLAMVHTWAFAIGNGDLRGDLVQRYSAYDMLVLDGQGASAAQVRALHAAGKVVLAYLDVGTIEPDRPWYASLKRYRLDYWPAWGEWYANLSAAGFRNAIAARIAPRILAKGFDGLFLDNTDMVETHRRQAAGMRRLVARLSRLVHARGGALLSQNGEDLIGPLLRYYDGWNREDVSYTYSFRTRRYVSQPASEVAEALAALRRVRSQGLLTLATDYTAAGDASASAAAVRNACSAGALPFVSDIGLSRIPATPARC